MPCKNPNHIHFWPSEGVVVVERCEKYCQFCKENDGGEHEFGSAWFLRRHIRDMHAKPDRDRPLITDVPQGWTGSITGNAKPHSKDSTSTKRRARKTSYRSKSKSPSPDLAPFTTPVAQSSIGCTGGFSGTNLAQYLPEYQALLDALTKAIAVQAPQIPQDNIYDTSVSQSYTTAAQIPAENDPLALLFPEDSATSHASSPEELGTATMTTPNNNITYADNPNIQNINASAFDPKPARKSLYELYTDWDGTSHSSSGDVDLYAPESVPSSDSLRPASTVTDGTSPDPDSDVSLYAGDFLSCDDGVGPLTTIINDCVNPASTVTSDCTIPANSTSDGCIDPSMLSADHLYEYVCGWSTPQSIRTNHTVLEAQKPTDVLDGSPDRLVRRLNEVFLEVRADTTMTDEQILGTSMSFLEAFQHGRPF